MLNRPNYKKECNDYIELSKYLYSVLYNFIFEYPKHIKDYDNFKVNERDKFGRKNYNLTNRPNYYPDREISFDCHYKNCYILINASVTILNKTQYYIHDDIRSNFEIFEIGKNVTGKQDRAFYTDLCINQIYYNRKRYFRVLKQFINKDLLAGYCIHFAKKLDNIL